MPFSKDSLKYGAGGAIATLLLFLYGGKLGPFSYLAHFFQTLPLFFLGLGWGVSAQVFSVALIVFMSSFLLPPFYVAYVSVMALGPALLVTFFALSARQSASGKTLFWCPPGRVLSALSVYGLCILGILHFGHFIPSEENLLALLKAQLDFAPSSWLHLYAPYLNMLVRLFPSLVVGEIFLLTLLNALIAQLILVKVRRNLRPTPVMADIQLLWWSWPVFAGLGVMAFLISGPDKWLFLNGLVVLSLAFLWEGLGIVHGISQKFPHGKRIVLFFYGIMLLWSVFIVSVVLLGIFNPWIKLQDRFARS